jgi:hypothetical protein
VKKYSGFQTPLVSGTEIAATEFICDFCFYFEKSKVDPSGRFLTDNDQSPTVTVCNGCKLVRYCTKVNQRYSSNVSCILAVQTSVDGSFNKRVKDFNTIATGKKDFNTIDTPKKILIPLLTPHTDF